MRASSNFSAALITLLTMKNVMNDCNVEEIYLGKNVDCLELTEILQNVNRIYEGITAAH